MKKTAVLALLSALIAVLAFGTLRDPVQTEVAARAATHSEVTSGLAIEPTAVFTDIADTATAMGESLRYQITTSQELELGEDAADMPVSPGQDSAPMQVHKAKLGIALSGECSFTPLLNNPQATEFEAHCDHLSLEFSGSSASAFSDNAQALVEEQLQVPFFFVRDSEGRVLRASFDPKLDPLVAGLLRNLVASFQLVQQHSESWDTSEIDATGKHIASYQQGDATLSKRRHDYQAEGARIVGDVQSRFGFEGSDLVTLHEAGHFDVRPELGMPAKVTTVLDARLLARVPVELSFQQRQQLVSLRKSFVGGPLNVLRVGKDAQRKRDQQVLGSATVVDLIDSWEDLPTDDADRWGMERARLQSRFEAALRLDPNAAKNLVHSAHANEGVDPDLTATMTAALGSVGSAEAQRALIDLVADAKLSVDEKRHALATLGLVEQPNTATFTALQATLANDELRDTAALALGNAASAARIDGLPGDEDAWQILVRELGNTSSVDHALPLWYALENTGDPRLLQLAPPHLSNPQPAWRAAAAACVRLVQSPAAVAFLVEGTANDDDAIAIAAARALRERPFALALASQSLLGAPVARARVELLAWFVGQTQDAQVRAFVLQVAETDDNDEVREAARAIANLAS